MEHLKVAVVSSDEAYNRVFCMSLLHACKQIEVTAYTTRQFVLDWADYRGPGTFYDIFDIILWAGEEVRDSYGDNIIYLTDRASLVQMDYAGSRFALYRFSPACTIIAELFDIYTHLTGRGLPLVKRENVGLLAFASFRGGCGCTTFARSVCQTLSRFSGKRVFCISLEDVDSAAGFLSVPDGVKTEGEFLYRLLGKGSMPFLDSYMVRDEFGVCSFAPPAGRNPLRELSKEEMQTLLAALMDSGRFDVIAADLSTCLTEAAAAVLEAAEHICILAGAEEADLREAAYMNQLVSFCGTSVRERVIRVVNSIPHDGEAIDLRAPLEGKFGQEITKLTEKMLNMLE